MIVYINVDCPKQSTKKIVRITESSKVTRYKKNKQKSIVFLCTIIEHMDIQIKNILPLTLSQ